MCQEGLRHSHWGVPDRLSYSSKLGMLAQHGFQELSEGKVRVSRARIEAWEEESTFYLSEKEGF